MSSAAEQPPTFTFDEYLKLESVSDVRHEYVGGHVYAMTGGSVRHGLLVQLINARLLTAFLPKGVDGGVLEAGPAALDVTEIFDQLDALDTA